MSDFYDIKIYTAFKADKNNPRHSEGSIIELKDGSLLMAWQCFQKSDNGSNDTAPANISIANSYDNGATWVNKHVVAGMTDFCVNCYSPAFFRDANDNIVLLFKRYTQLEAGKIKLNNCYHIESADEGKTWSEETLLWENRDFGIMNDCVRRLSDGSLLMPIEINPGINSGPEDHEHVAVLRSTDDFKTYTQSKVITCAKRGLMEPCIAERNDGSLNMVMRTQLGAVYCSDSTDGGKTWSEAYPTPLIAPESCPCVFSIPGTDAQLVIWNNTFDPNFRTHFGKRSPLTMAISRDGLKTFSEFYNLETDEGHAFTNPAVMMTSDGLFVLNYWTCKYSDEWLMNGTIDLKIATFRIK